MDLGPIRLDARGLSVEQRLFGRWFVEFEFRRYPSGSDIVGGILAEEVAEALAEEDP